MGSLTNELWNAGAEAWFEGGGDGPSVAMNKVHAELAELQSTDSPKIRAMVK